MNRSEILDKTKEIITKDRCATHGKPEDSFKEIAHLWTWWLDTEIKPYDVAMMMSLLKQAREKLNAGHDDNLVDAIGYHACAAELKSQSR